VPGDDPPPEMRPPAGAGATNPFPTLSTVAHWVVERQATALREFAPVIAMGVGVPGAVGSNVTSEPLESTAVHWDPDGHATELRL
jgi:hypothetical protein